MDAHGRYFTMFDKGDNYVLIFGLLSCTSIPFWKRGCPKGNEFASFGINAFFRVDCVSEKRKSLFRREQKKGAKKKNKKKKKKKKKKNNNKKQQHNIVPIFFAALNDEPFS